MPRKHKPVQGTNPVPGQQYGNGIDQQQAMQAVPLPDVQQARENATHGGMQTTGGPNFGPTPGTGASMDPNQAAPPLGGGGAAGGSFEAALQAARGMAPPGGTLNEVLANPGQYPNPGDSMAPQNAVWTQLAELTGDPYFLKLAQQARLMR